MRSSIAFIGNSITGGTFASRVATSYPMVLTNMIRGLYPGYATNIVCMEESVGGTIGQMYETWMSVCANRPSIVCLNVGDNDVPSSYPQGLSVGLPVSGNDVTMSASAPVAQLYKLYSPATGAFEWIYGRSVSGTTLQQLVRGVGGTQPRYWGSASTSVAYDAGADTETRFLNGTAWLERAEVLVRSVLGPMGSDYRPVVLVGGMWYYGSSGTRATIDRLGAFLQARFGRYPNFEFVPFVDSAGKPLKANAALNGPTTTLVSPVSNVDTTLDVNDCSQIVAGNYILVTETASGVPLVGDSEVMKVTAVDYNLLTLSVSRAKLGSSARGFSPDRRVCLLSLAQADAQKPIWVTLGSTGFDSSLWCYGDHPTDAGHSEIAMCYMRAFERVMNRIGG